MNLVKKNTFWINIRILNLKKSNYMHIQQFNNHLDKENCESISHVVMNQIM
jgi:hypothetical protein